MKTFTPADRFAWRHKSMYSALLGVGHAKVKKTVVRYKSGHRRLRAPGIRLIYLVFALSICKRALFSTVTVTLRFLC
jgi:hypothetical protein